jgi:hypothetical protein
MHSHNIHPHPQAYTDVAISNTLHCFYYLIIRITSFTPSLPFWISFSYRFSDPWVELRLPDRTFVDPTQSNSSAHGTTQPIIQLMRNPSKIFSTAHYQICQS